MEIPEISVGCKVNEPERSLVVFLEYAGVRFELTRKRAEKLAELITTTLNGT